MSDPKVELLMAVESAIQELTRTRVLLQQARDALKPEHTAYVANIDAYDAARSARRTTGDEAHPCRFCQHPLGKHGFEHGCEECDCLATPGEARAQAGRAT